MVGHLPRSPDCGLIEAATRREQQCRWIRAFRDPRIAASLKRLISPPRICSSALLPRSPDCGLIEACRRLESRGPRTSLPRSPDCGLIEAHRVRAEHAEASVAFRDPRIAASLNQVMVNKHLGILIHSPPSQEPRPTAACLSGQTTQTNSLSCTAEQLVSPSPLPQYPQFGKSTKRIWADLSPLNGR